MGMVGGTRHYTGGGLGDERGWRCPACGAENAGLIAEGCALCGSGTPGRRVEPPPPPSPPAAEAPREAPREAPVLNPAQLWIARHPNASLEEAFTAGYVEGVRAQLKDMRGATPPPPAITFAPEGTVNRTIIAALQLFRDQVLVRAPEEIQSGEWMSVGEVNNLLDQLRAHEATREGTYA